MLGVEVVPTTVAGLIAGAVMEGPAPAGDAKISGGSPRSRSRASTVTVFPPGSADPYVTGLVKHDGSGLGLTGGGTKGGAEELRRRPWHVDAHGGRAGERQAGRAGRADLLPRRQQTAPPDTVGSAAILEGTTVSLTKEAAELLKKTFKTDALTPFFEVAIAKVTVNTK